MPVLNTIEPTPIGTIKIPELDPALPEYDDGVGEGDDHLRLVKGALRNTFPVIGEGQCPLTAEQINHSYACMTPTSGMIMWWFGDYTVDPLPIGWALCDGGTHNGIVTPLIESVFLKQGNTSEVVGQLGGIRTHTDFLAPHTLISTEVPIHSHDLTINLTDGYEEVYTHGDDKGKSGGATGITTNYIGGNESHHHPVTQDNLPAFYVLEPLTYVGVP